jgi:hypothetical protein
MKCLLLTTFLKKMARVHLGCFFIMLTSYSLTVFAHQPASLSRLHNLTLIQRYEKNLNVDILNNADIASAKLKAAKIETFLKSITDYSQLHHDESQALGKLIYKLGVFYTNVIHEPDLAINKMILADTFLTEKKDKAWNYNYLAYAYEQKLAVSKQETDKEHAAAYINKVIADLYANAKTKEVAFAYCLKGLLLKEAKYDLLAKLSFRLSTEIYQSLPDSGMTLGCAAGANSISSTPKKDTLRV